MDIMIIINNLKFHPVVFEFLWILYTYTIHRIPFNLDYTYHNF